MAISTLFQKTLSEPVFLGSPEAEAEAVFNSRTPLSDLYEDLHSLEKAISAEKFIVVARKGCGKSAFAEWLSAKSQSDATLHCDFVKTTEMTIEKTIQEGSDHLNANSAPIEAFFKWLIFTRLLRLFTKNESIKLSKEYIYIEQFLNRNSGHINITDFEIKEITKNGGFEVQIEYLRRFLTTKLKKEFSMKAERAPFYKLIPHLQEVVTAALQGSFEKDSENRYIIFFDDLDLWFKNTSKVSVDNLMALVRVCKQINNDIFGKNSINAKVVILLRDDIESVLAASTADSGKIFSTYAARINWYQDVSEESLKLKEFIVKRIVRAFEIAKMPLLLPADPWSCLVAKSAVKGKGKANSSFKKIIDYTLYRPRDLLLFFKPLEEGGYTFPLSEQSVDDLLQAYSVELVNEMKNELSAFYSVDEIDGIFRALAKISKEQPIQSEAQIIFSGHCINLDCTKILKHLFDRSIIGIIDERGHYWFKHREKPGSALSLEIRAQDRIGVQYGIREGLHRAMRR